MKRKEIIQGIISTMQRELPFDVIERDVELPVDSGQMVTVCGVRRCGKSFMMKIVANRLIERGINPRQILWVNFDDERLDGMTAMELDEIVQAYREMFPDIAMDSVHIFFDEIQTVDKWELFVLRLYKTYTKNIYISGSNAKMLSSQLATALRGWPLQYEIFPLSLDEYCRFKNADIDRFSEEGRARMVALCHEYIHASSFPDVVLTNEESIRIRKVQGYFNTMLFRDLLEHFELSKPEVVKYFIKSLMANLSKPTSINNIYNDIKSQGIKVDKNRLYEIAEMVCDIFLFYKVNKWSPSLLKERSAKPKFYIVDNGIRNAIIMPQSHDRGKLLENAVFMHLRRNMEPACKITYFSDNYECDFIVQKDERIEKIIQVCWSLSDEDTLKREVRGIMQAHGATGCNDCSIITFDDNEREICVEGVCIRVVKAWKWLADWK